MRSNRSIPVCLSNSYLTLDPIGISITAVNCAGNCSPGVTSCQACVMIRLSRPDFPRKGKGASVLVSAARFSLSSSLVLWELDRLLPSQEMSQKNMEQEGTEETEEEVG